MSEIHVRLVFFISEILRGYLMYEAAILAANALFVLTTVYCNSSFRSLSALDFRRSYMVVIPNTLNLSLNTDIVCM